MLKNYYDLDNRSNYNERLNDIVQISYFSKGTSCEFTQEKNDFVF